MGRYAAAIHRSKSDTRKEDLAQDVDLDSIANTTNGYSGSDLKVFFLIMFA